MKTFTKTIKSLVTGAAFVATAMVATSANASITIGEDYVQFVNYSQVQTFCGHAVINCTDVVFRNGVYTVWFS